MKGRKKKSGMTTTTPSVIRRQKRRKVRFFSFLVVWDSFKLRGSVVWYQTWSLALYRMTVYSIMGILQGTTLNQSLSIPGDSDYKSSYLTVTFFLHSNLPFMINSISRSVRILLEASQFIENAWRRNIF